jgi:hypothetical protein
MKTVGLVMVALGTGASALAGSGEDQSYFAILAETKMMRMAGMPAIEIPDLPPGVKLPPGVVLPGKATRSLNVRLWSPLIAPDNATASVSIPSGLKLGEKLDLELYRPTPEENSGKTSAPGGQGAPPQDFTIKFYWGSSATVQAGQPKIIKFGDLTPEQMREMSKRAAEGAPMSRGGKVSYFYRPNWTTGYWPTQRQPGTIDKDASLVGSYNLTTTYAGNVSIDVPSSVNFLAPIDMTSPDLSKRPPLDQAIQFKWAAITGALGLNASIIGMEGRNTLIVWSSSETFNDQIMADTNYLQMAEVRQRVADHLFMGPDTSSVTVPAGIFKDADFAMMNMIAYGPGSALDNTNPIPRVQTKSTLQIMLGGKAMKDGG